VKTSFLS